MMGLSRLKRAVVLMAIGLLWLGVVACGGNPLVGTWADEKETITFNSDGTYRAQYYWLPGSYRIEGNQVIISSPMLGNDTFTYKIEKNELILMDSSGNERHRFKKVK